MRPPRPCDPQCARRAPTADAQRAAAARNVIARLGSKTGPGDDVIHRDFDFEGKGLLYEPFRFDAPVAEAIARSRKLPGEIAEARKAVNGLQGPRARARAIAELNAMQAFVKRWDAVKIPLAKRDEVVKAVADYTARLLVLAEKYREESAHEVQEAAEREAQEKKEKKERAEREKAKAEKAAKQAQAAQNARDLAAREREAEAARRSQSNNELLRERGVLLAAQEIAKAKAQAETEARDKALLADHARAYKGGTKAGKARADTELKEGQARLEAERARSTDASLDAMARFAGSAAGRRLEQEDLAWVVRTAGADTGTARALAEVISASGADRTVARALAHVDAQELPSLARHCIALLAKGNAARDVLGGARLMERSPEVRAYVASAGAALLPGYLAIADLEGPQELNESLAYDLKTPGTAYTVHVARRLLAGLAPRKPDRGAVNWLTRRIPHPEFLGLVELALAPDVALADVRAVFTAAKGVYDGTELLGLCQRHRGALADLAQKVADGQPGCPGYTDLVMKTRHLPHFGEAHQLAALRAVALLEAGSDKVTVEIGKNPVDFGRGPWNPHSVTNEQTDAKTGFVTLSFTDLAGWFEIHTHWAHRGDDGRIYSMHVEHNGTNGIEIHSKQQFRPLIDKVVALHKAHYPRPEGGEFDA